MNIVLTNDDGIDAPGLEALYQTVRDALGPAANLTVVAPDRGRSECGHSVTTGRPLKVTENRGGWYAIDGTPVDCVRVALGTLVSDVDLVFSGVNAGANLGVDLLVSGTFAAAREASLLGVHAMAISHYRRPEVPKTWEHVPRWARHTVNEFIERSTGHACDRNSGLLWNVNLPAIDPGESIPRGAHCPVDPMPITRSVRPVLTDSRNDTRGGSAASRGTGQIGQLTSESVEPSSLHSSIEMMADFHGRPRVDGSDVERCFSGFLTISEIAPHL